LNSARNINLKYCRHGTDLFIAKSIPHPNLILKFEIFKIVGKFF